jgi:glutathione S-transferase
VRLFHILSPDEWAAAQASGWVAPAGLAAEGFVHCSTEAQVAGTIERHFPAGTELLVLVLDPGALGAEVRWEPSPATGEDYPHVYGRVPVAAVVDVRRWSTGATQPSS